MFFCSSQLAGVVAVEITGGPEIQFNPGRMVGDFFFLQELDMSCYILFVKMHASKVMLIVCRLF